MNTLTKLIMDLIGNIVNIVKSLWNIIVHLLAAANNYHGFLLVFIALMSLALAYSELVLKRRPYITIALTGTVTNNNLSLDARLENHGTYPGVVRIKNSAFIIGNNTTQTQPNGLQDFVLTADKKDVRKIFHIGTIFDYNNAQRISSEVIVEIEIESKPIGGRHFQYISKGKYKMSIANAKPTISVISEDIN